MLEQQLKQIGLLDKEAKVYLASLELGSDTASEIAKRAGVNRPTTYAIIEKLIKKGLMSTFEKDKKTLFQVEDPRQLLRLLKEQEENNRKKEEEFKKYLPELETLFNLAEEKPKVRFFEGKNGLEVIKDEILKTKDKEIEAIFSVDDLTNVFSKKDREDYLERRLKKGIKIRAIYNRSEGPFNKVIKGDRLIMVSKDKFPISVDITIFSDRVALSSLRGKLVGVIIENKEIANTLKTIFDLAWKEAGKYRK